MRLRDWCKARGVTLTEVMVRSGVAYSTVIHGANGKIRRYAVAQRISDVTDGEVSVADLCEPLDAEAPTEAA